MKLVDTTKTFEQEPDCCSPESTHRLTLETADGGGGMYLVIRTARWALEGPDDIDKLAAELKRFLVEAQAEANETTP